MFSVALLTLQTIKYTELTTNGDNTVLDEKLAHLRFVTRRLSHQIDLYISFDQVLPLSLVIE
jgi:hypothetical protein